MKKTFLIPVLFFPFLLSAQKDFVVEAHASRTLTPAERTLSIRNMTLGDNCSITIPENMDGWTVTASDVTIGNNVSIAWAHKPAANGVSNRNVPADVANCLPGTTGPSGTNGMNGPNSKNISLNLRIRSIGTLIIEVIGGAGGNGGSGGSGGKGGNATCTCNAGPGGNGGNGGRGGNGGNGGNVSIVYSTLGNATVSNSNFMIRNEGGIGGTAGFGPMGGPGGDGFKCPDPKAAVRLAGAAGLQGHNPSSGESGMRGSTTIKAQ